MKIFNDYRSRGGQININYLPAYRTLKHQILPSKTYLNTSFI